MVSWDPGYSEDEEYEGSEEGGRKGDGAKPAESAMRIAGWTSDNHYCAKQWSLLVGPHCRGLTSTKYKLTEKGPGLKSLKC